MNANNPVLAMYDVRGIQDYIFRTSKMKDAIGASHIVETLFDKIIDEAAKESGLTSNLIWYDDSGVLPYDDSSAEDVKVMYIGGGNACVIFSSREAAITVSRLMANKTMEKTYSLQLAVAVVDKTDDYSKDYANLMDRMVSVKDRMMVSRPLDALPIMDVEIKTGLPMTSEGTSCESALKNAAGTEVRKVLKLEERQFDSYVSDKGESSMLAVIHIDGNNMGLRIRELIADKTDYEDAVNEMRRISYTINTSYKKVFTDMVNTFNDIKRKAKDAIRRDASKWWIMKVIDAGDDITYVCNANIAFASVECFLENISNYSMKTGDDTGKYRFSACAGISYFNSHFPFSIAYNVAEECCESAKSRAKEEKYRSEDLVANWVDFQFCRSVHAQDLKRIRTGEYKTSMGENLLRRPYYVYSKKLSVGNNRFEEMKEEIISYDKFKEDMGNYVLDGSNLPRSFVKEMRNTYPLGENQMEILKSFLKSREDKEKGVKYPDEFYFDDSKDGKLIRTALIYDALEVADYYNSFDHLKRMTEEEAGR